MKVYDACRRTRLPTGPDTRYSVLGAGSRLKKGGFEMSEHQYLHADEKDEVEVSRLALQASIIDPIARALADLSILSRKTRLENL